GAASELPRDAGADQPRVPGDAVLERLAADAGLRGDYPERPEHLLPLELGVPLVAQEQRIDRLVDLARLAAADAHGPGVVLGREVAADHETGRHRGVARLVRDPGPERHVPVPPVPPERAGVEPDVADAVLEPAHADRDLERLRQCEIDLGAVLA